MSAHTGPARRRSLRRTLTAAAIAAASGFGFIAAAGPALAAGPWYVATTGANNASCGTQAAPCATVTFMIAQTRFIDGDTINVAAGTYTDRPVFSGKTANVVGAGTASTIFSGSNTSFAIGVAVTNAKTFRLSNATLTAGKTALGGGLAFTSGQVSFTSVNITSSTSTNVGGGAAIPAGGSLTMNGGTVSGNTATNGGGGIYVPASASITLSGTTLTGNTGALGGGLYVAASAITSITNGAISTNSAPSGGGGVYDIGSLNVTGTTFNANTSPLGAGLALGGGVYTMTGATISNNVSTNQGGGIYFNTGSLALNSTMLTGNKAPNGAGIYQNAGSTTVGATTTITNNTASATGGGVYEAAGSFTSTGTIDNNTATTLAGGVAVLAGSAALDGGSLSNNSALNGGGLYNGGTATIDGATLTGNAANGGTTANGGNGGAIYNSAALIVKNATFNANKAVANTAASPGVAGYGGAILSVPLAAAGAPTLAFTNTTINGDNAGTPVSGGNAVIGGAIAALGNIGAGGTATTITANGLTLSKNVALAAGGLYTIGATTLTGSTLTGNQATNASAGLGGAMYVAGSTTTLDGTALTGNSGAAGGGGAVVAGGSTLAVKNGSSIDTNDGPIGGGVDNAGTLTVSGSEVKSNTAANSGAGIFTYGALTLTNSHVDNNAAAFLGGGVATSTTGSITSTGGTISGNNAFGAGGALLGDGLVGSFDGTDFIGNTSTGANFGGGAILSGGQLSVSHATLSGNTADGTSGSGGAIFSGSSSDSVNTTLKVDSSLLTGNESYVGSAIYAGSTKTTSTNKVAVTNSTISANTADGPFGALELAGTASIVGSTITDNTAVPTSPFDAYGAIIAKAAGTVSLSGSILSGNSGHQCNVAVADGGYNLNSPTASECSFSAGQHDLFAAPQLGALASNGGPTQSRLPSPTSPALDQIAAGTSTGVTDAVTGNTITLCGTGATDQRGTARPQGAKCDIGAVEADQTVPTVNGPAGATYSVGVAGAPQTFTSSGSPQPTLSATGMPSGVTFTDNGDGTGTLAGKPGANTGGTYAITVKATNEAGSDTTVLTLTVDQAPLLAGPGAATYTVGHAGSSTFTTTGNPTPALSSLGILPAGVAFTDNGDGTGSYAGTPAVGAGGQYGLTVKASNGTPPDASAPFALTVDEAPSLTGPGSSTFKVGTASSSSAFTGSGFPAPTLSATGLPAGLTLAGTGTAKITGTAANGTGGDYPGVVVSATNGIGSPATKTVDVTVNEAPELTGPTDARFVVGSANSIGFSSDGYPVAAVTESGTLPSGLSFHDNGNGSATISGTAATSSLGTYPITITASNGQSPDAVLHTSLVVAPPLSITTTSLPSAAYHSAYSATLMAAGGQPGYTFAIASGSLPAGLTMNSFGQITGSPTVSTGIYLFTIKATDSAHPAQTATKIVSITVTKGVSKITPTAILLGFLPNGDITINLGLVEADLSGGYPLQPISGATVTFKSGTSTVCSGKTDAKGHAQCSQSVLNAILTPLRGSLTATYAGDLNWIGSTGSAALIQKTNP
jgi:parallel beta-helix repeat protein